LTSLEEPLTLSSMAAFTLDQILHIEDWLHKIETDEDALFEFRKELYKMKRELEEKK